MDDEQSTWVKLHRKTIENEIFRHDFTAWHVFEVLLIICDKDKGVWSGGMYQLVDLTGIQKPTLYKAILRLEKAGMINRGVNGRYTRYNICNWSIYQANGKQRVNSRETLGNTLTRIENKEIYSDFSEPYIKALKDFKQMRKLIKKPMTDLAETRIIERLKKLYPNNEDMQLKSLEQSVVRSWADVYPIKDESIAGQKRGRDT